MASRGERSLDSLYREIPPATMTREQEAALSARHRAGDPEAANELACGHLRFAAMVAGRYHRAHPTVALSDLTSAAFYGLLDAAKKFDGSRGIRFCSYATHRVNQMCRLELAKLEQPVRLPNAVTQGIACVKEFYSLPSNISRRPHSADVPEIIASRPKTTQRSFVEMALIAQHNHKALDAEIPMGSNRDNKGGVTWKDQLVSNSPLPDESIDNASRSEIVQRAVADLPAREQMIIRRYFLGDENGETISLEDIAAEIGLTRERIRQLKNRALERMRRQYEDEFRANVS